MCKAGSRVFSTPREIKLSAPRTLGFVISSTPYIGAVFMIVIKINKKEKKKQQ